MALRPDRNFGQWDISYFCNDTTADRGGPICLSTAGSGAAMDQAEAVASYVATPSGAFALGVLMQDVVNLDLTRQHINQHKDEVQTGGKVAILVDGYVDTNRIYPSETPTAGAAAYVGPSGYFSTNNVGNQQPQVGRFLSTKDEDGYCKVLFGPRVSVNASV